MSFFGDLVSSIETGKAPPRPQPLTKDPVPAPSVAAHSKPLPKPHLGGSSDSPLPNSLKRKADERDGKNVQRLLNTNASGLLSKGNSRPATPTNSVKPAASKQPSTPSTPVSAIPGKAPPKGSYADILARAKQAQEQRTQSKVGQIKHQATNKEKPSKLAERRREEQDRQKAEKQRSTMKPGPKDRAKGRRSTSPQKTDQARAVKVPKAPRPPLHAPQSTYKGTMGKPANNSREASASRVAKRGRYDEYLGTDEDEDDEMEDDGDGYGYDSEGSSDMEAGIDDMEREEALALRAAKEDDARELALEAKLKREKEERRKKLESMAKKGR